MPARTQLQRWREANPKKVAEQNKRRRERYAADDAYREECKQSARDRPPEARLNGRLKSNYGMDLSDYRSLVAKQDGRCAICGTKPGHRLYVDHCHDSGRVRGLLCSPCNFGLGHFKDDPERLNRAMVYLVQSQQ